MEIYEARIIVYVAGESRSEAWDNLEAYFRRNKQFTYANIDCMGQKPMPEEEGLLFSEVI